MKKRDLKGETMWEIKQGDAIEVLKTMPDQSVHCCVTSPPYQEVPTLLSSLQRSYKALHISIYSSV